MKPKENNNIRKNISVKLIDFNRKFKVCFCNSKGNKARSIYE